MTRLAAGVATDVGLVRANNQDHALVADPLFAVADGMGGHAAGEVASQAALDALHEAFSGGPATLEGITKAVETANRSVWDRAQSSDQLRGMGTTLTAVALVGQPPDDGRMAVANVGDSRTYRLRAGELAQLTVDHSYVNELVAEGRLHPDEAELHPQRHVLTRALGVAPQVEADVVTTVPEIGDRYLLCSDGLSRELTDSQIASVLRRLADPGEAARELVTQAKYHGGSDNITVVVVDVLPDREAAEPPPPEAATTSPADHTVGLDPAEVLASSAAPGDDVDRPDPDATMAVPALAPAKDGLKDGLEGKGDADATPAEPIPAGEVVGKKPAGPTLERIDLSREDRKALKRQAKEARRTSRENPKSDDTPRQRRARLITFRVVGFVFLLLVVVAAAGYGTDRYARSGWFVGLQGQRLAIYEGRPGGFLWWQPVVHQPTAVSTTDIESSQVPAVRAGVTEPSVTAAQQYIFSLVQQKEIASKYGTSGNTTKPTTSSSTTVPKTSTTR